MNDLTIYRCSICGNLIVMINDAGVVPNCCGQEMDLVSANVLETASEKHVPVIKRDGDYVHISVGSVPHPMTEDHYICCIILVTDKGAYLRTLDSSDLPEAYFRISDDEKIAGAYDWCNIHGLWKEDWSEI